MRRVLLGLTMMGLVGCESEEAYQAPPCVFVTENMIDMEQCNCVTLTTMPMYEVRGKKEYLRDDGTVVRYIKGRSKPTLDDDDMICHDVSESWFKDLQLGVSATCASGWEGD